LIYRLLRSDLMRMISTRSWRLVAAVVAVLTLISVYSLGQVEPDQSAPAWSQVGSVSGNSAAFLLCIAAFDSAAALRDGIDVPYNGRRWRLTIQLGRVLAVWAVGLIWWICCGLIAVGGGLVWIDSFTWHTVYSGGTLRLVLGGLGSTLALGTLGVAVGCLIRRPGLAVAVALGWFALVENTLSALVGRHERWLPGRASAALLEHEVSRTESLLSAGLILTAWTVGMAVLCASWLRRAALR